MSSPTYQAYVSNTTNGQRVLITLEELGLDYQLHLYNLRQGDQKQPDYLKLNPLGRIPTLVAEDQLSPMILTQTVAIMIYLAERHSGLLPTDQPARAQVLDALMFAVTDLTAPMAQGFHLGFRAQPPHPEAQVALKDRALYFYRYLDQQLAQHPYAAGSDYSLADIMALPTLLNMEHPDLASLTHLARWKEQILQRDPVQKALAKLSS